MCKQKVWIVILLNTLSFLKTEFEMAILRISFWPNAFLDLNAGAKFSEGREGRKDNMARNIIPCFSFSSLLDRG